MKNEIRLAEMLCTRLCHDITGPVGAISNGVEFLAEGGSDLQDQAVDLISQSAAEAVNRLTFFRNAYGRVNAGGEASLSDAKDLVQRFLQSSKLTLDWPDSHTDAANISISRKMARVIYNLVIVVGATLIRGGTLSVRITADGAAKTVSVSGTGPSVKWDVDQDRAIKHEMSIDEVDPKAVLPYFIKVLADDIGAAMQVDATAEQFAVTLRQAA